MGKQARRGKRPGANPSPVAVMGWKPRETDTGIASLGTPRRITVTSVGGETEREVLDRVYGKGCWRATDAFGLDVTGDVE